MLSVIATCSDINKLRSTTQCNFSRGLKEFKQEGYGTTVSKLNNNLIRMNAVNVLNKKQIN